jgi:hypothetical protein
MFGTSEEESGGDRAMYDSKPDETPYPRTRTLTGLPKDGYRYWAGHARISSGSWYPWSTTPEPVKEAT